MQKHCFDDGRLRAWLDGELLPSDRRTVDEHLATCRSCTARADEMRVAGLQVSEALATAGAPVIPLSERAWARTQQRIETPGGVPFGWRLEMISRQMGARWRMAGAGAMAALLLVAVMTVAPLRTAASQFLDIFRVQKFAVIQVDPAQLEKLDSYAELLITKPEMSDPTHTVVGNTAEASAAAGFRVLEPQRLPANMGPRSKFTVQGPVTGRAQVNIAAARQLFAAANLSTRGLPDKVDTAAITASAPPMAVQEFGSGSRVVAVFQGGSPEVNVPEGVDLQQVSETGLRLLGLSQTEAARLSRDIDFATTLLIPVPLDMASVRPVTVRGEQGYILREAGDRSKSNRATVLVWHEGDQLFAVVGTIPEEQLVETAESLK